MLQQFLAQKLSSMESESQSSRTPRRAPKPPAQSQPVALHTHRSLKPSRMQASERLQSTQPDQPRRSNPRARSPNRQVRSVMEPQRNVEEELYAAQLREEELLSVFRQRRQHYDEAVVHANTILSAFGDATELLPKEHRVRVKEMCIDGTPMPVPKAMYHLKPQGRDVQVLNDSSWVEDPFQLDDVDAEEQVELNAFMKRKDAHRSAQKSAEATAIAKANPLGGGRLVASGIEAMAQTSGIALESLKDGDHESVVIVDDVPPPNPTNSSKEEAGGEGGELSHPSEVARKRRIIRKLWMGNVIQLRDLYASKAGGFHNIGGGGTADRGGAGIPLPTIEFQDGPAEEGAEVLDLSDGLNEGKRVPFSQRPIPPVPQFSSRSLAWIAEAVCHDMNAVTSSTEDILRAAMNTHTRRTGALDTEIQRCAYLGRKMMQWCEGAKSHAAMYDSGEGVVSTGIIGEMGSQRREVVNAHEEVSQVQKMLDDASATIESIRAEIEVVTKRNAVLSFALDSSRVLDPDDRDTNSDHREAMIRLRQLLHTALAEMNKKTTTQRRSTVNTSSGVPPTAVELAEIAEAAQRIMDSLSGRYGGMRSFDTVSKWVLKAKGAVSRRRSDARF